jgi:hypothetical protein
MDWFTLAWATFLNGVLVASTTGAMGLNHRKNGVINLGVVGLMYFGNAISSTLAITLEMNPYWSIPLCIFAGVIVNIVLNIGYIDLLRRLKSTNLVSFASIFSFVALYLFGNGFKLNFFSITGYISMTVYLRLHDFSLFTVPGVLVIGTALVLFSTLFQIILGPVTDDGPRGFDKWDMVVYALSGAAACISGALYPFWFSGPSYFILVVCLAGALVGGFEKKLNSIIGGFLSAALITWATSQLFLGMWISRRPSILGLVLILVSLPLYPRGLIGSIRRVLEYNY